MIFGGTMKKKSRYLTVTKLPYHAKFHGVEDVFEVFLIRYSLGDRHLFPGHQDT